MELTTAAPSRPFPLPSDLKTDPLQSFFRAATAIGVAAIRGGNATGGQVAREFWKGSRDLEIVARAASVPATLTTWGATFATTAIGAFIKSLSPQSAAARLFDAALQVPLTNGIAQVNLPRNNVPFPEPQFVIEADPFAVRQGDFTSAVLGPPRKLGMIVGLTEDLRDHSAETAEAVLRAEMIAACARALDAAVFSTAAASTARPAGILNGVTPITPTAGAGQAAMLGDLRALVGAIVTAGGGQNIFIFARPSELLAAVILGQGASIPGITFVPAPSLTAGQIVAVEAGAIASGFPTLPDIDISREALIHFDTVPQPIGVAPNIVASPTRSLWQTASLALRLILRVAWTVRAPGMVQVVNSATW
jgi:hypothetical protein